MSEIKIVVDGKETVEIAPETLNLKSGDTLIIKIKSGNYTYEFLGNLHKLFAKKFPYNQIIIIPTEVDFEEYPKEVNLDSCIEYVKNVIKDETKPYLEIYEHIYKILNDYKKLINVDHAGHMIASVIREKDGVKTALFVDYPDVSVTSGLHRGEYNRITVDGYNISGQIVLTT